MKYRTEMFEEKARRAALSASLGLELFRNTYLGVLDGKDISNYDTERAVEAFYMLEDTILDFLVSLKEVE